MMEKWTALLCLRHGSFGTLHHLVLAKPRGIEAELRINSRYSALRRLLLRDLKRDSQTLGETKNIILIDAPASDNLPRPATRKLKRKRCPRKDHSAILERSNGTSPNSKSAANTTKNPTSRRLNTIPLKSGSPHPHLPIPAASRQTFPSVAALEQRRTPRYPRFSTRLSRHPRASVLVHRWLRAGARLCRSGWRVC